MAGYRQPLFVAAADDATVTLDPERLAAFWTEAGSPRWPLPACGGEFDLAPLVRRECQVFDGPGLGEMRTIVRVEGRRLHFDRPWHWPLTPDSLLVAHEHRAFRWLTIVDNVIEDAGPPLMIWGHGHECIIVQ